MKARFIIDLFEAVQFTGENLEEMDAFLGGADVSIDEDTIEMCDKGTGCAVYWPTSTWFLKFEDGDIIPMDNPTFEALVREVPE